MLNGHYGLIVSLDDNRQFAAQSATFSLVGQNIYLFGVGIRTYKSNIGRGADSVLLGDPVPWPPLLSSALAITLASPRKHGFILFPPLRLLELIIIGLKPERP
ncbi:MAG: hypothetical protein IPP35_08610 [Elusimicrobia bacterium]|nr:hypothetical protein [Elusimicrobiota bacterium]